MSGVLKKACWLLPVLFVVSPVLAQQGGGIQSAANIESHISFMSVFRITGDCFFVSDRLVVQ
ncbi:MAG: hypothetical protein ACLTZU_02535 [Odoribacter splanchnicus]